MLALPPLLCTALLCTAPHSTVPRCAALAHVRRRLGVPYAHRPAAAGISPCVGARRVFNVLVRRTKNNPVVLGESGVGKTALVEGLAQRIAADDCPQPLKRAAIVALDMGSIMAGAWVHAKPGLMPRASCHTWLMSHAA